MYPKTRDQKPVRLENYTKADQRKSLSDFSLMGIEYILEDRLQIRQGRFCEFGKNKENEKIMANKVFGFHKIT